VSQLDPALFYDFTKLAAVCKELDFAYEQLDADEFKVILRDDLYIVFINLMNDTNPDTYTLVHMDEFQHTHGTTLGIGTYTSVHYLDVLLLIRTGEVLIYEKYYKKKLSLRWLVHCTELANEFEHLESGDEIHIIRL
jgi:hypothetical protein